MRQPSRAPDQTKGLSLDAIGRPRILVVYQHLPHYRYGVFHALNRSSVIRYEFAADTRSRDGSIPTMPSSELTHFHRLHNVWFKGWLWQRGLIPLISAQDFDGVIFLGDVAYVSTWFAALLARLKGKSVFFWTIGWHREDRGLKRLVRLRFYALAHKLLLYGNVGRTIGLSMGVSESRMVVIGNSSDSRVEQQDCTSQETELVTLELPHDEAVVLTAVARLNTAKRLDLLIAAAHILQSSGTSVVVMFVGDGPERQSLQRQTSALGIPAYFAGPVYGEAELRAVYEVTTLTVVPANAGLTAVQSLSYGCPVITGDDPFEQKPEAECVVPGVTGDVFRAGSAESLAETITDWITRLSEDSEVVAAACREEVSRRWSATAHAAAIEQEVQRVFQR